MQSLIMKNYKGVCHNKYCLDVSKTSMGSLQAPQAKSPLYAHFFISIYSSATLQAMT